MDYMPETLQKLLNFYSKTEQIFPPILIKLFSYQIFKALSFLQTFQICHRDLKPKNILFDPSNFQVKLCDFGNAKILVKGTNEKTGEGGREGGREGGGNGEGNLNHIDFT